MGCARSGLLELSLTVTAVTRNHEPKTFEAAATKGMLRAASKAIHANYLYSIVTHVTQLAVTVETNWVAAGPSSWTRPPLKANIGEGSRNTSDGTDKPEGVCTKNAAVITTA